MHIILWCHLHDLWISKWIRGYMKIIIIWVSASFENHISNLIQGSIATHTSKGCSCLNVLEVFLTIWIPICPLLVCGEMNTFSELEIIVLLHYITCIFAKEINNYDWRRQSLCSFLVQASTQILPILYFCWKVCGCWNCDRLFNIVKRQVSAGGNFFSCCHTLMGQQVVSLMQVR